MSWPPARQSRGIRTVEFAWLYETYIAGGVSAATTKRSSTCAAASTASGVMTRPPRRRRGADRHRRSRSAHRRAGARAAFTIVEEGAGGNEYTFTVSGGDGRSAGRRDPQCQRPAALRDRLPIPGRDHRRAGDGVHHVRSVDGATPSPDMLDETSSPSPSTPPSNRWGRRSGSAGPQPGQVILVCSSRSRGRGPPARLRRDGQSRSSGES